MAKRVQTDAMRNVLKKNLKCELCGSDRDLEAHHIIPVSFGGRDVESNILCVCHKCHALLTPHGELTRLAMQKRFLVNKFYKDMLEMNEADGPLSVCDVFDYLDSNVFPLLSGRAGGREWKS